MTSRFAGKPVGHGSQFLTYHEPPLGQIESTITVVRSARTRLEFDATSKRMDLAISFTFTETASGTLVHGNFDPSQRESWRCCFRCPAR